MNDRFPWKFVPPAGPVLSLLLIGLVLLSGLLYYRAIKIQRFLEPALALSQPRNEFAKTIRQIFEKEFGAKSIDGIKIKTSSILIEKSLLFAEDGALKPSAQDDVQKLARIFLALMKDDHSRSDISLVLLMIRYPSYGARPENAADRIKAQKMIGLVHDALLRTQPELGIRYSTYFTTAAQPTNPHESNGGVVEFRIVPSEYLHIEVLERLEKYSY